jgi:Tfp pilus assembly protein PilF
MPKAKEAARRALELAPDLAEAHTALAAIIEAYDWDWQAAEHEYLAALRLNPNSALCHFWYAGFLWDQGRLKEASREVRRAYELDPLWVPGNLYLARLLMIEKEYDKAARQYRRTLDLDPNNAGAHVHLGWIYLEKSMPAEAAMEFEKARSLSENSPAMLASLAYAYARLGKQDKVPELLLELDQLSTKRYVSPFHRAQIYGVLKDRQALEWLEKAYDERCTGMIWLRHKEKFAFLETDPRFRELVARMRFVS